MGAIKDEQLTTGCGVAKPMSRGDVVDQSGRGLGCPSGDGNPALSTLLLCKDLPLFRLHTLPRRTGSARMQLHGFNQGRVLW